MLSTNRLIRVIKNERPDVVHLHCINGYFVNIYKIISYLKKKQIKTLLTLHAEFMYTANCGYALDCDKWITGCGSCPRLKIETKSLFIDNTALSWKKMKKAFEGFDDLIVTSVSPWLQERAERSPILRGKKHLTVLNGIDTSVFCVTESDDLKRELGLEGKKIVFHATAAFLDDKNHIKGGYYVIEMAKKFAILDPNVTFVIAGRYGNLHDLPSNIILLGNVSDQKKLSELYSMADITLLTSKKETFSMIVAESLCCGTPIVGFEAGAPEMITIKEYSSFVEHANMEKMLEAMKFYLYDHVVEKKKVSDAAMQKYSRTVMSDQYQRIYCDLNCNSV